MMDTNFDGTISVEEFSEALKKFDLGLTENQIYDFVSSTDENKDGVISYTEFLKRFSSHDNDVFISENISVWLKNLRSKFTTLTQMFDKIDKNGDGIIDFRE